MSGPKTPSKCSRNSKPPFLSMPPLYQYFYTAVSNTNKFSFRSPPVSSCLLLSRYWVAFILSQFDESELRPNKDLTQMTPCLQLHSQHTKALSFVVPLVL